MPEIPFAFAEAGAGPTALVLHAGGGPGTVAGLVQHLAATRHVLAPTCPGWSGTPRPEGLTKIADVASAYLDLLERRGTSSVAVLGSSMGGWLAAEVSVQDVERSTSNPQRPRAVGALVLIDAVGIEVPGEPMLDVRTASPAEQDAARWHDPSRRPAPAEPTTPQEDAVAAATEAAFVALACEPHYLHDPRLAPRLGLIDVPALLLWGASDGICTPAYGRAYAALVPGARFVEVPEAGHLPQVEQPDAALAAIDAFLAEVSMG